MATFIMRGRMQAIAVAATCLMLSLRLPPLSLLAAAVVALVTLRMGWREGLNTLVAGALAAGLLGAIVRVNFILPAGYGLMLWLPVWGAALVLRQGRDLGWTLEAVALLGLLGVGFIYLVSPDPAAFWQGRIQQVFGSLGVQAGLDPDQWKTRVDTIARYMTGVMAAGMVSSLALSLLLGRWWQSLLFNPGGFRSEFLSMRLHKLSVYLVLGLAGAAVVSTGQGYEAVINLLVVLGVLYVVAGTAVLHAILAGRGQKVLLAVLYVLMLFVPHVFAPIALVGFTDAWFDWRARFMPAGN
ncbi:MAG: DUF2232 domain-containing protein [Methylothermaceae bacterium]|nr:DUF2232 domain-containing protein [Methylothermaceae bacterium]